MQFEEEEGGIAVAILFGDNDEMRQNSALRRTGSIPFTFRISVQRCRRNYK